MLHRRRNSVVLTPPTSVSSLRSVPQVTVAIEQGSPGRSRISRKPLRREGRSVSAEPVCSCAPTSTLFAHGTAGAASTRSSLRPLVFRGRTIGKTSGAPRRENANSCLISPPPTRSCAWRGGGEKKSRTFFTSSLASPPAYPAAPADAPSQMPAMPSRSRKSASRWDRARG